MKLWAQGEPRALAGGQKMWTESADGMAKVGSTNKTDNAGVDPGVTGDAFSSQMVGPK